MNLAQGSLKMVEDMQKIKDYDKLRKIISKFNINGCIESIKPIDNGIINTTYVVSFKDGDKT